MTRADARRNRERLLTAADAAFAETDTDASLEEIARRAGVGIGTLYRHFPTRHDLVAALVQDRFDELRAAAERAAADEPLAGLLSWLQRFIASGRIYRGLPASVLAAMRDETSALYTSCHAMRDAGAALVARAQQAGELRATADPADVLALAAGIAWLDEQAPESGRADRLLTMVTDGLRT